MHNFSYARPRDVEAALRLAAQPGARFIAGGTNLVDLMKGGVETPARLIDISRIGGLAQIHEAPLGRLRLGALATNADTANHPLVRERYPLLSQAILAGASPQLRNLATTGGNLLQRTRCSFFYDTGFQECNKRDPGSGCAARGGFNRNHAILGASDACIAVNPSDMSVALAALDALVQIRSSRGSREVPLTAFQRLPGETPQHDTVLAAGEMIVAVDLPPNALARHSYYLKIRDRASYAFALVSVAAALEFDETAAQGVKDVRLVVGGVAHKPWRVSEARALLVGKPLDPHALETVADAAVAGAKPCKDNAFKVPLMRRAIVRALCEAAAKRSTQEVA
jgi:xanthine dehydrogenase YagS FAD-binding subunit